MHVIIYLVSNVYVDDIHSYLFNVQSFWLFGDEIIDFIIIVAVASQSSSITNSVVDTKLNHGFEQRVTTPRFDLSDFDELWDAMHRGFPSGKLHYDVK